MICDLTCRILREACSDARGWPPNLQLSVNISATQLRDPRLAAALLAILTETGFPRPARGRDRRDALLSDLEAARAALTSLQNLGVKIALDDFGAGYSNLRHLREQRFNKIKIDKSYLANVEQGGERAKLADAMMQIGASLSLQTTAEASKATPTSTGSPTRAATSPGYLFGSAMSKDEADKFIQSGKPRRRRRRPTPPERGAGFYAFSASGRAPACKTRRHRSPPRGGSDRGRPRRAGPPDRRPERRRKLQRLAQHLAALTKAACVAADNRRASHGSGLSRGISSTTLE